MPSSGLFRCVALVKTEVSEEHIASIIRVTRIDMLGTRLALSSNRSSQHIVSDSLILVTLMMEAILSSGALVLTRTTRCNFPEGGILHSHRRENLISTYFTHSLLFRMVSLFD
jgi:hypothetical protein